MLKRTLNKYQRLQVVIIQRVKAKYFLKIAADKLEILQGFSIATKSIKNIIDIIQSSENAAAAKLILVTSLNLTNKQADAGFEHAT